MGVCWDLEEVYSSNLSAASKVRLRLRTDSWQWAKVPLLSVSQTLGVQCKAGSRRSPGLGRSIIKTLIYLGMAAGGRAEGQVRVQNEDGSVEVQRERAAWGEDDDEASSSGRSSNSSLSSYEVCAPGWQRV